VPPRPQIDTSQVVINKVYGIDSGTAVEFYALFKDQAAAQPYINAFASASA
jgi:ABC-type metal ion transport system substrate-binding protein